MYQGLDDLLTLDEMAREEQDPELEKEANEEALRLEQALERLEMERMFSGPNDNDPCYMDIQSGSGGTEAQDWAEMVMRMYIKFGEKHGFNVTVTELSDGEVAGIKSATLRFEGDHAYRTVEHIPTMAKKAKMMVREAIDAFIKKDLTTSQILVKMDDEIDALFEEVKQEVTGIIKENSERIDYCIDFLMIAKYLERIGDHAVNICEWLEFNQTGTMNDQKLI